MDSQRRKMNRVPTFVIRNSLLTDLFENIHIRTVYNLFIAMFVGLFVNTVVYDYLKKGEIVLGLKLIKTAFGKMHVTAIAWMGYLLVTCLVHVLFKVWAKYRHFQNLQITKLWDWFWVTLLTIYYVFSFVSTSYIVTGFKLPPASAAVLVVETVRFLMKIHSFVRNSGPSVLSHKPHSETNLKVPTFSSYFYFLFAPTLIFQEQYPRTEKINWSFACFRLIETVAAIFYMSFVIDRFLNPSVQDFGLRKYTVNEIILAIFENTAAGMFMLLPCFFLVLHSFQNLFAEITRFGDRLFYRDWWTCTDFSGYFRKWNVIVQSWLYLYIYKDFNENILYGNVALAKLSVFLISAIVHEWILTYMFGFYFPLLFVEFLVLGSIFSALGAPKTVIFNILLWYSLGLGMGSLVTLYGIEFYARANAPLENSTFIDNVFPRFLTCDCIEYN